MNKCDIMNIEKCKKIGKSCNNVTGRCIKEKIVDNVYKINKYRHRQYLLETCKSLDGRFSTKGQGNNHFYDEPRCNI